MHSIRSILSISLLLTLFSSFVLAHRPQQEPQDQEEESGFARLQKLLDQVDAPSLHAALHDLSPKKFKHGMFQDDRTAVEAIHKDEPSLATSVVNIAKRNIMDDIKKDLAKRAQDISNGTTTTTPTPAVASTTGVAVPVPQGGDTSTSTTSSPSSDTSTTSSNTPSTTTSTSTSSNGAVAAGSSSTTSTSTSAGASPSTTSTSSSSLTHGEVVTSTNSVGLTIVSTVGGGVHTISPSPGSSTTSSSKTESSLTSTVVHTSTLPNGSQSVVTAVTVVGVGAGGVAAATPSGTADVTSTGSSSGSPGIQTAEAPMTRGWRKEMVLVIGGAVGVAMMM